MSPGRGRGHLQLEHQRFSDRIETHRSFREVDRQPTFSIAKTIGWGPNHSFCFVHRIRKLINQASIPKKKKTPDCAPCSSCRRPCERAEVSSPSFANRLVFLLQHGGITFVSQPVSIFLVLHSLSDFLLHDLQPLRLARQRSHTALRR